MRGDIVEQHVEDAVFVWSQRRAAEDASHLGLRGLSAIDERLEANLDGLRVAGEVGALFAAAELDESQSPGAVFVCASLAIDADDLPGLAYLLDEFAETLAGAGISRAIAWAPADRAAEIVPILLDRSCAPAVRRLGVAAALTHDALPEDAVSAFEEDDATLAQAVRAAASLGHTRELERARALCERGSDVARCSAGWAFALLGERRDAVRVLREVARASLDDDMVARAAAMLARVAPADEALSLADELRRGGRTRAFLATAAALGDPRAMPDVLDLLDDDDHARAAARALVTVTGVELDRAELTGPARKPAFPTDDAEDEGVDVDPEARTPWPSTEACRAFWGRARFRFEDGARYLLGAPMDPVWLRRVLEVGHQTHRRAAAVELALRAPGTRVFDVRARADRQRAHLPR